jgi:hypothetical protein
MELHQQMHGEQDRAHYPLAPERNDVAEHGVACAACNFFLPAVFAETPGGWDPSAQSEENKSEQVRQCMDLSEQVRQCMDLQHCLHCLHWLHLEPTHLSTLTPLLLLFAVCSVWGTVYE